LPLVSFKCSDFRCLESVALSLSAGNNLICGANASGKTSILEAIAYLGRGRSFRGAGLRELLRHGQDEFVIFGKFDTGVRELALGIRNSKSGLEVRTDGEKRASAAALAEAMPLQVIDPEVHELVAGGPDNRRRYVDWIAFHVEQGYLDTWRRYRRTLKQRNAALRSGAVGESLSGWDQELAAHGEGVDAARRRMLDIVRPALGKVGEALLGSSVGIDYQQGWAAGQTLLESLAAAAERDVQLGSTQAGPHRADLKLVYDERQARKLVSRGQQKLLACAMILAATEIVQSALEKPLLLLLDDPAAELDRESVQHLMSAVEGLGCQVIATTLDSELALFSTSPRLFHVEHGVVELLS
jgi:DNA replication and repair protein RecF